MDYDVFNGDADGIISLIQLRLNDPREAELVTGRKRDINLLERVPAKAPDRLTVLDVSMRSNLTALRRILADGASVLYFDHHNAGEGLDHPNLEAHINTAGEICTAVLVDRYLDGAYRAWAVTASFGDNFADMAQRLAHGYDLPLESLKTLGEMVNYNGYGATEADLHFHPADLYLEMSAFETPMAFMAEKPEILDKLTQGYADDFRMAESSQSLMSESAGEVRILPDSSASRRISGMFGNQLAQSSPERAHAILTEQKGGFLVSIRAPVVRREGADKLAMQFETGGGRAAAAGINHLKSSDLDRFIEAFRKAF